MAVPMEALTHMMAPFETGQIKGLEWLGSTKRKLKPTRTTQTFKEFRYIVDKPTQVNKLFNLGDWDREIAQTPWKRGWGAQQLALTQAAGQRGETTIVSSVTGKVTVQLRAYTDAMPSLMMMFHVSTMDAQNHIIWARQYDAITQAGLRKLMHHGLNQMVADSLYPTGGVATALAAPAQDSVWSFLTSLPPPNQAALTMEE